MIEPKNNNSPNRCWLCMYNSKILACVCHIRCNEGTEATQKLFPHLIKLQAIVVSNMFNIYNKYRRKESRNSEF